MDNKLDVNGDWYPSASSKITYVLSRLGGKPDRQTMNRRIRGCINPYNSHEEIIEELADIYEEMRLSDWPLRVRRLRRRGTRHNDKLN